jgi:hypothetical protein
MPNQDWFSQNAPQQPASGGDWFSQNSPQGATIKAAPSVGSLGWLKEKGWKALDVVTSALPAVGGLIGGVVGSGADVVSGPVGTVAGAALGGAGGEAAKRAIREGTGLDQPAGWTDTAKGVATQGATQGALAATGELAGAGLQAGAGALKNLATTTPVEQAAIKYGIAKGVPVDAATATGNKFVRGAQTLADQTPIGAVVAGANKNAQAKALTRVGNDIATSISPTAQVPESAGNAVGDALTAKIAALKKEADTAYGGFRSIVNAPGNIREVPIGQQTATSQVLDASGNPTVSTTPVTQKIATPVDMRGIKQDLKPMLDSMDQWIQPAKKQASAGYQALNSIVNGPDYIPAVEAEKGLGGLKALARESDGPNLANTSQGVGGMAATKLQGAIDDAVQQTGGPGALRALQAGRAAHADKMATADTLQSLRDEPVQLFNQLTYAKDAGIDKLREVAKVVPTEMPKVGRAYLDQMMTKATANGGFDNTQSLWSQWQNLGPETKKILFNNPMQRSDLDNFFTLAKKLAENPNPSGSALVGSIGGQLGLMFYSPQTGVPMVLAGGALSKMLRSPVGVKLLMEGMAPKAAGSKIAQGLAVGNVIKQAGGAMTRIDSQEQAQQFQPAYAAP